MVNRKRGNNRHLLALHRGLSRLKEKTHLPHRQSLSNEWGSDSLSLVGEIIFCFEPSDNPVH